ncbi:unnamed protein product [Oncorhynchus mykiss]|uniref:Leucine zipper with capping helix domain-containing protein n=1 Tax=Oncorhynchus mykiss TaxID=8022 RepID=A0A060WMU9_ONCMY|nr:unnamed protein product [Oncorhynchus mykiss]
MSDLFMVFVQHGRLLHKYSTYVLMVGLCLAGKSNVTAKEAVSRWTDNVFAIKSWAKRKFGFDDGRIDKAFGIPEDFDYMD